jgi:hypothetical protein
VLEIPQGTTASLTRDINLAHHTHLRCLTLRIWIDIFSYPNLVTTSETALAFLSQITSSRVDLISLEFHLWAFSDFGVIDWARMERILTHQRFSNLRRLSVQLWSVSEMQLASTELQIGVRSLLPILERRGIIYFPPLDDDEMKEW